MKRLLAAMIFVALAAAASAAQAQTSATSTQKKEAARTAPVRVGEEASDFTLEDQTGRKVTLSEARGQAPVVLVFYRGYW